MIPNYLLSRDKLKLNEVLWKYWLSLSLPMEAQIIVMAAGLELLFTSWYKSNKSKTKGSYLPPEEFHQALENEFILIKDKLSKLDFKENPEFKDRILKKIENSCYMSGNEKINFFFDEIGLKIGDVEKTALNYRNKPAHGHTITENNVETLVKMTNVYHTLVNRTILKILGFEMEYIDFYLPGYPKKI